MLCRVPCFNALNGYFYVSGGSSHCSNFVTQPLSLLKSYISYLRRSYLLYCGRFEAASLGCMVYRRNFCSCEKEAWKNSGLYGRDSNPWPLRYRAEIKSSNLPQAWIFSGFLFATAKVASISAMIFLHIITYTL